PLATARAALSGRTGDLVPPRCAPVLPERVGGDGPQGGAPRNRVRLPGRHGRHVDHGRGPAGHLNRALPPAAADVFGSRQLRARLLGWGGRVPSLRPRAAAGRCGPGGADADGTGVGLVPSPGTPDPACTGKHRAFRGVVVQGPIVASKTFHEAPPRRSRTTT